MANPHLLLCPIVVIVSLCVWYVRVCVAAGLGLLWPKLLLCHTSCAHASHSSQNLGPLGRVPCICLRR
jgi:hypothetical protein